MNFEKLLASLQEMATQVGFKLLAAIFVLIIGLKIASIITKRIKKGRVFSKADGTVRTFMVSFVSIALKALVILTVVSILGVPMSSLVAVIASAGVAIGLAAQGALSNLVGGMMILIFRPFKVGDYIDTVDTSGTVDAITVFYTMLHTVDDKIITIPNGTITSSVVTNYSASPDRRIDMDFYVAHDEDIDKVRRILLSACEGHDKILSEPSLPVVVVKGQDLNGIHVSMRIWCRNEDYWDLYFPICERANRLLSDNGIILVANKVDVRINNGERRA